MHARARFALLALVLLASAALPLAPADAPAVTPHHCVHGAAAHADAHLALVDATRAAPAAVADALAALGARDVRAFHLVPVVAFHAAPALADAARHVAGVTDVVPDALVHAHLDSSAPAMGAPDARAAFGVTGADVTIAVVDTGVDAGHASLDDLDDDPATTDPKVVGWFDAIAGNETPYDDHGHGTHVAGTAAGTAAGSAFTGVAPGARVVGVKVLNAYGSGAVSTIIAGMEWIADHKDALGVDVVTMSLGSNTASDGTDPLSRAAAALVDEGLVVTVSAGNCGPEEGLIGAPAAADGVLTVGAAHDDGTLADFSSRGPTKDGRLKPDVIAPGVDVTAPTAGTTHGYHAWSGTSMATPHVAGLAALMLDATGHAVPARGIMDAVRHTARDAGAPGPDARYGHGHAGAVPALEHVTRAPYRDVAVTRVDAPSWVPANVSAPVNVTLMNQGSRVETDLRVRLVDGNGTLALAGVPALPSGARERVTLTWPGGAGTGAHAIRVIVDAVDDERVVLNNARTVTVRTIGCVTPGPDAYGYACRTRALDWIPMPANATAVTPDWWTPTAPVPLGFTFHWYGAPHDAVRIGPGWLTFDERPTGCCAPPVRAPSPHGWNAVVLALGGVPMWDELVVRHASVATDGGRAFVTEFTYEDPWPRSMFHAQVQLHEGGHVAVAYRNVTRAGCTGCGAGVEDASGRTGLLFQSDAFGFTNVTVEYRARPDGWRESGAQVALHPTLLYPLVERAAVTAAHRHDAGADDPATPPARGESVTLGIGYDSWPRSEQRYVHVPYAGGVGSLLP